MAIELKELSAAHWLGGIVVLAVALGAIYVLVFAKVQQISGLYGEQEALARELEELAQLGATVAAAEIALHNLDEQHQLLERQLPLTIDFGSFYGQLADAAEDTGVILDAVAPASIARGGEYLYLPVDVDIVGAFPQLYHFIHRVTHLPRLSKVEQFTIDATDDPGSCTLSITLHIFAAAPPLPEVAA